MAKKPSQPKHNSRKSGSRVPAGKPLRRKDEKGPLGWLKPELESAHMPLVARGSAHPAAARPGAGTSWRDLLKEYKSRKAAAVAPVKRNWLPLGPTVILNGQTVGNQPVGGRVSGIAVVPGGQTIFAASANGGVFRSDDGGTIWRSLMDGFDTDPLNFASASVICGAIAINPADPKRIYVGTGEGDTDLMFRQNLRVVDALPAYRGIGPLKSDDGGSHWAVEDSNPDLAGEAFFALAVDPADPDNVVAATSNGLYHRVPAAGTFRWDQKRPGVHSGVVVATATRGSRFVAAEWGKSVVESRDGGKTWHALESGFPTSGVLRIALAMSSTADVVYALISASPAGGMLGLYRLDSAGGWKKISGVPDVLPGKQGDYDLCIAISPGDVNTVYIGGDSTNVDPYPGNIQRLAIAPVSGGYKVKEATSIGTHAHSDIHTLVHTPGDPTELWCGCDGGIFLNRDPRGSGQFASQNVGLSCLCTNFFAQHPTDPNVLIAGLQDNGTALTRSGAIWTHVQDGDGGYCVINWRDASLVLVYMNGYVYRSQDGGSTFGGNPVLSPKGQTMTLPVISPPYDPAVPAAADVVAVGGDRKVYVSPDFGTTWPENQRIALPNKSDQVFALAFGTPDRLFIGTTQGSVFRADRSRAKWSVTRIDNAPGGALGLTGLITDIAIDWSDATRSSIFISFGGQSEDRRRVWRFDGARWEARSGPGAGQNLLNVEHNAIVVDPAAPANVYAAADIGVWHSADSGLTWDVLQNGLPGSPVYDLLIHPTQRLLRAATHGRGVYELALA